MPGTTLATDTNPRLFLLGLSEQIRALTDATNIQFETCRLLANFLKVGRAYYLEIDEESGTVEIFQDYFGEDQTSLKGISDIAEFSDLLLKIQEIGHYSIEDINYFPNLSKKDLEFFNSTGIRSLLCTPVLKYGRIVGIMRVADSSPRQWNQETITLVKEVGDRLWDTVERGKIERRLQDRNTDLEDLTKKLRELASELTLAEHRTRELLSKTLHDSLQQLLFSASLSLKFALQRHANEPLLHQAQHEIKEAMELTRTLSLEIFPPALRMQGLPEALKWLGSWAAKKYKLDIEVEVDERANPDNIESTVLLFESVRELLFNVAKHARAEKISLKLNLAPNDDVKIIVSDNGAGFDPRKLSRNSSAPAGLGIFSIKERLSLMGGKFNIDSVVGRGTVVTLSTPLYGGDNSANKQDIGDEDSEIEPVANGYSKSMSQPGLRILLADDHTLVREGLRRLIETHNGLHLVGEAVDGRDAIEKAMLLRPDVIVMDVSMPVVDGIAATRKILRELPDTLVFGLSTHDDSASHPIKAAGAAYYFSKRDGASELIKRLLEEQKSRVTKISSDLSAGS